MELSGKLVVSVLAVVGFCISVDAAAQTKPAQEPMVAVSFRIGNLPVWTKDASSVPRFDASVIVSKIKSEVSPKLWKSGRARLIPSAENQSLILFAPQSEHSELTSIVASLLARLSAFAER